MSPVFRINGSFWRRGKDHKFSKEISSTKKELALDRLFSLLGSNHKVKRCQIHINKVEEIPEK